MKFRRQHPIGPYIVDFYCREARLVIEIEPGPAARGEVRRAGAERAPYLEELGLRVLRLSSDDVATSFDSVLGRINELLRTS